MEFTIDLKSSQIYIYGLSKHLGNPEVTDTYVTARVKIKVEPEVREWGIKFQLISIESIEAEIEYDIYGDNDVIETCKMQITHEGWDTASNVEFTPDGMLTVNNLEIDFRNKTLEIS